MRVAITFSLTLLLAVLFSACAQKQPFSPAEVTQESALVYIYRPLVHGHNTPTYRLYVDDEKIPYVLGGGEYAPVYVKAGSVTVRAVANGILEQSVILNLHKGRTYFIRTLPQEGGTFTMQRISDDPAQQEIVHTFLSGSELKIDAAKKKLVPQNKPESSALISDEIAKLYKMKEQGIITETEFIQLKTKLIAR